MLDERPMFIAFIMAGDGEVDQCVGPFETYDLAQEAIDKLLKDAYDPSFDRAYVVAPQSMDAALAEIEEAKREDAEAAYKTENAVDGLPDGMERFGNNYGMDA